VSRGSAAAIPALLLAASCATAHGDRSDAPRPPLRSLTPHARLDAIRRVASHPVALAQCRRFFAERPGVEAVVAYDTAGSVMELMRGGADTDAAIASALAAQTYGGEILIEGIEDDPQNYTRFLIVAREPVATGVPSKTTLVFSLEHMPGALHKCLGPFARRGVDLSKIESRPLRGRPWEYIFYLDVLGDPLGEAGAAIAELREVAHEVRILGSYPQALERNT